MAINFLNKITSQVGYEEATLVAGGAVALTGVYAYLRPPLQHVLGTFGFQAVDGILLSGIREIYIRKLSIDENDSNFGKFGKIAVLGALFFVAFGTKWLIFSYYKPIFLFKHLLALSGIDLFGFVMLCSWEKGIELWKNRVENKSEQVVELTPQKVASASQSPKKVHANPTRLHSRIL